MKFSFQRPVSSKKFIPEIDGLRFVAITAVVLYHLTIFLDLKGIHNYTETFPTLNRILRIGHIGVPMFFVLSGFILGLPFAKHFLLNERKVNLKNYFFRRIKRIEPPYFIAMTICFLAMAFYVKKMPLIEAVKSYLSSLIYSHNIVYGKEVYSKINGVAWSLEIEIQFYILTPLLTLLFKIKQKQLRRKLLVMIMILMASVDFLIELPFYSIVNYLEYFLAGFLLLDFYLFPLQKKYLKGYIYPLFLITALWTINYPFFKYTQEHLLLVEGASLVIIFGFFYSVIVEKSGTFFSNKLITTIGGMCYTIYLIHSPVISFAGNLIAKINIFENKTGNILFFCSATLMVLAIFSAGFYLLVEKPFMNKKN